MKLRGHIRLLAIATLVWAAFVVGGLPSYYQQYSTKFMIGFDVVVLFPIAVIAFMVIRGVAKKRRLRISLWLAFYFTVPLAIYDWVYCGLLLGHGMAFIGRYWYLSVYYAIPWILFPLLAICIRTGNGSRARRGQAT